MRIFSFFVSQIGHKRRKMMRWKSNLLKLATFGHFWECATKCFCQDAKKKNVCHEIWAKFEGGEGQVRNRLNKRSDGEKLVRKTTSFTLCHLPQLFTCLLCISLFLFWNADSESCIWIGIHHCQVWARYIFTILPRTPHNLNSDPQCMLRNPHPPLSSQEL